MPGLRQRQRQQQQLLEVVRDNTVRLLPSQISGTGSTPLPYTGDPWKLVWNDILLFFRVIKWLPFIFYPFSKARGDETYPGLGNFIQIFWQVVLVIYQVLFLLSLPFCFFVPLGWFIIYVIAAVCLERPIWWLVNGFRRELHSKSHIASETKHPEEYWIFINGVSVGRYWLQANIDRLAQVFGRPVTGIHNPTNGLIFDLVQCMIERNFCYSTQDIRDAYKLVKAELLNPQRKKIVMILHSQGGIQGSLIIDWLLAEVPDDILRKLEVYTFGCAANHFNNPYRDISSQRSDQARQQSRPKHKAIRYIEHYANDGDFVANWGILNFAHEHNRFMGRLFERHATGHLLNQHYLNYMFPLGPDGRALDSNDFMETVVDFAHDALSGRDREGFRASLCEILDGSSDEDDVAVVNDVNSPVSPVNGVTLRTNSDFEHLPAESNSQSRYRVKDFSRLWQYRNGGTPEERRKKALRLRRENGFW